MPRSFGVHRGVAYLPRRLVRTDRNTRSSSRRGAGPGPHHMAFGCGTSTVDTPNHCRNLITPAETLRPPYEGEVPLLLEMLNSRDIARKPGLLRPQGIVNLADRGHLFAARSVGAGQRNKRAKDLPSRAAAPPIQQAYHGRLS